MDATETAPPREREAEAAESRCACCQPASATSTTDQAGTLAARRAAIERRLKGLLTRSKGRQ